MESVAQLLVHREYGQLSDHWGWWTAVPERQRVDNLGVYGGSKA